MVAGFTNHMVEELASHLAAGGLGLTWNPDGLYTQAQTGIFHGVIPDSPARIVTLTVYTTPRVHEALTLVKWQVRSRGRGGHPQDVNELADNIRSFLDGAPRINLPSTPLVEVTHTSGVVLGQDSTGRWARSDNYQAWTVQATDHTSE